MLLLAGFCLDGIVCATFLRPVEWPKREQECTTNFQKQSDQLFGHGKLKNSITKSSEKIVVKHIRLYHHMSQGQNTTGTFKNIGIYECNDSNAEDIDVKKTQTAIMIKQLVKVEIKKQKMQV